MVEYINQIKELEDELKNTKYNKRTQHHIGLVKAKIARLKEKQEGRGRGQKKGEGYHVRKSGDACVILVGYPSVGKSTLLNRLTNAESKTGAYDFTTLTVVPGLMEYKFAKIQVLDVPGIVSGAAAGTGRGREVLSVMQSADMVIFLVDVNYPGHLRIIQKEVYDAKVRVNKRKPDVRIKKTAKNGIRIGATIKLTHLTNENIEGILREFRINNADILLRDDITDDELIDCIESNRKYMPAITVLNKCDTVSERKVRELKMSLGADLAVSASRSQGVEELKKLIYDKLGFISIFLREPGKEADMKEPLIMQRGCTIKDVCEKLHRDFLNKFKFARIWGQSVKFSGQKIVKTTHILEDKDVIELHIY